MAIIVKVQRGTGDREGPSINDPLIVTEYDARTRGQRWLDENYWLIKKRTLKVPHKSASIVPRTWITVSDGKLGLSSKLLKVRNYAITITRSGVWAVMDTEEYNHFYTGIEMGEACY